MINNDILGWHDVCRTPVPNADNQIILEELMNLHQSLEKPILHNANIETQQINTASVIGKSGYGAQSKSNLDANGLTNRRFWRIADDHYHENFYREH